MLTYRSVRPEDMPTICSFPQSARELFFLFPKASYPLIPEQLHAAIAERTDATAILRRGEVVGFASFSECVPGAHCSIGNVIVDPRERGAGVGRFVIETMIRIAVEKHAAREVRIACFDENVMGLLLYEKLGFEPCEVEARRDEKGEPVSLIHMRLLRSENVEAP